MSKFEEFLNKDLADAKQFAHALRGAAFEIREEELGLDKGMLAFEEDVPAIKKLMSQSIYVRSKDAQSVSSDFLYKRLEGIVKSMDEEAVVFRGTRCPVSDSSFNFSVMHTTLDINTASSYANGMTNSGGGIGRILNSINAGFINSYQVSLNTKTYKNFEYEDLQKVTSRQSNGVTLQDVKEKLQSLLQQGPEAFKTTGDRMSPTLKSYYGLTREQNHYECLIPCDTQGLDTYFLIEPYLIKVDKGQPKWDLLMARTQEALYRDFYEIKPLDDALQIMSQCASKVKNKELFKEALSFIEDTRKKFLDAPWQCTSLNDFSDEFSPYLVSRPYIKKSTCVGSSNKCLYYPEEVEKIRELVTAIRLNEFEKAASLLPADSRELEFENSFSL